MVDERIVATLIIVAAALIFRAAIGGILKRKLREITGHQLLANALTGILGIGLIIYLFYVWGVIQALVELLATFGIGVALLLLMINDIWIKNLFAGFSLIGDKSINVGSEIEVDGKRGKIVEMTLTVTRIRTIDGHLMIVPNKKFREDVVVIRAKRR